MGAERDSVLEQKHILAQFQRVELLKNLPLMPEFLAKVVDRVTSYPENPNARTNALAIWARTGSGKKTLISEIDYILSGHPQILEWEERVGLKLRRMYASFADTANLCKSEGRIDPRSEHGHYTPEQYRIISKRHFGLIAELFNNFEEPTLVYIEPSGPTARVIKDSNGVERLAGVDRSFSVMRQMASQFKEQFFVFAMIRDDRFLPEVLEFREQLRLSTSRDQVWEILERFRQRVIFEGKSDPRELSGRGQQRLRRLLLSGMAPAEGVERSNRELNQIMEELHNEGVLTSVDDEEGYWRYVLGEELGMSEDRYLIDRNNITLSTLTLHETRLDEINIAKYLDELVRRGNFIQARGRKEKVRLLFNHIAEAAD